VGHLITARAVLEAEGLDRILLIPAATPPNKVGQPISPPQTRLAMLRAAVEGDGAFDVREMEVSRGGVSWTVETLDALREEEPEAEFFLILGSDQWRDFHRWREPRRMAEMARILVMERGSAEGTPPVFEDGPPPPSRVVQVPRIDLSSTWIRERVRSGLGVRNLVPEGVRQIIEAERLYLSDRRAGHDTRGDGGNP